MGILIKQGVQDTTQDNKFSPIVEKNVLAQITELKLVDQAKMANTLEVTFRVLQGPNKGRFFWDRVTFDPTSNFSWKYRALRKSAGVAYRKDEPATIDIEALLVDKAVLVDLGIRKGKNKNNEEIDYQNVVYKDMTDAPSMVQEIAEELTEVVVEKPQPTKTKVTEKTAEVAEELVDSTEIIDVTDEADW